MNQLEIEAVMQRYSEPAVLVHRVYPLINMPKTNSHLGGLPGLPEGLAWPTSSKGEPLHFLGQLDCSELPRNNDMLPDSGVLFFFALINEEMTWSDQAPHDFCRVIYAPACSEVRRSSPSNLGPIMGGWSDYQRHLNLPGDPPITKYPHWPITLHAVNSWANVDAIPREFSREDHVAYQEAVNRARAAEVVRVLGLPTNTPRPAGWGRSDYDRQEIHLPPDTRDGPFPQAWIMVDRIARFMLNSIEPESLVKTFSTRPDPAKPVQSVLDKILGRARVAKPVTVPPPNLPLAESIVNRDDALHDAMAWVERASKHGLDQAPSNEAAAEFTTWLRVLIADRKIASKVSIAISVGMNYAIQYAADSPTAAPLIPSRYYNWAEDLHIPVYADKIGYYVSCGPWQISGNYHQMLGNTRSSQNARSVDRKEVLLLQLLSDYGIGFMFCDVGEVEFWIDKQDLVDRRFDKVFATTCGG